MLKSLKKDTMSKYLCDEYRLRVQTTPGVGDFMYPLNIAYMLALKHKIHIVAQFYWPHDKDHLHHFEDPETIIERLDYSKRFFMRNELVSVRHTFKEYEKPRRLTKHRLLPTNNLRNRVGKLDRPQRNKCQWLFHDNYEYVHKNKIVIWRPLFNAETVRNWKNVVTNDMWEEVVDFLKQRYNVIELTYRTPIREAMYHCATCTLAIGYDGMWHYHAKNYYRPMIIASRSGITKTHTPHAMRFSEFTHNNTNFVEQIKKLEVPCEEYNGLTLLEHCRAKADRHKWKFLDWYYANR